MRKECSGVLFFSDFDSGNLERVEFVGDNFVLPFHLDSSSDLSKPVVSGSSVCRVKPKRQPADSCKQTATKSSPNDSHSDRRRSQQHFAGLCHSKNTSTHDEEKDSVCKEFRLWTRPDCSDTAFENSNRSWFHFGVECTTDMVLRLHMMNMNRQSKLMSQGMTPVVRVVHTTGLGPHWNDLDQEDFETWKRITTKPCYEEKGKNFVLTFDQAIAAGTTTFLAFTYPFSYRRLQDQLERLDRQHPACLNWNATDLGSPEDIYYCRELACRSVGGYRVDLITITSRKGMADAREDSPTHLFPDSSVPRCHVFHSKKVVFLSARVHPGETQSSFVINGFLKFVLTRNDPRAVALRDLFVFKLVPMLNPDGVFNGHYRTDLAGVNLNRTYLVADPNLHPSIFAARSLLLLYHQLYSTSSKEKGANPVQTVNIINAFLEERADHNSTCPPQNKNGYPNRNGFNMKNGCFRSTFTEKLPLRLASNAESGLAFYVDLHGHASKRGCFLYGNHFAKTQDKVESLMLAKVMSINFAHFDYLACNFSEQNMYQQDSRDGLSKEGSGRVSLHTLTGLINSYTLECNFNTGRLVNVVPSLPSDQGKSPKYSTSKGPPKYTPQIFEEAGEALAVSMLDLTGTNPMSRIPLTIHGSIAGLRSFLSHQLFGEHTMMTTTPTAPSRRQLQGTKSWGTLATTVTVATHAFQRTHNTLSQSMKGFPLASPRGSNLSCVNRSFRLPIWAPCRTLQPQINLQTVKPARPGVWSKVRGSMSSLIQTQGTEHSKPVSRLQRTREIVSVSKVQDHTMSVVGTRLNAFK